MPSSDPCLGSMGQGKAELRRHCLVGFKILEVLVLYICTLENRWCTHGYFLCVLTHTVAWKQSEETLYCYWIKLYKLYLQNFLIQLILRLPLNCVFVTFKTYVSTYLPALITDILWQILSQIIWIFRYREGSFPNFLNSIAQF